MEKATETADAPAVEVAAQVNGNGGSAPGCKFGTDKGYNGPVGSNWMDTILGRGMVGSPRLENILFL
jgi:hypothetical protein